MISKCSYTRAAAPSAAHSYAYTHKHTISHALTYAVVLPRERRVLLAEREQRLREVQRLALRRLERPLAALPGVAHGDKLCEQMAHEGRALEADGLSANTATTRRASCVSVVAAQEEKQAA